MGTGTLTRYEYWQMRSASTAVSVNLFKHGGKSHADFGWPKNGFNASPSDCDDLVFEMLSKQEMAQHFNEAWCLGVCPASRSLCLFISFGPLLSLLFGSACLAEVFFYVFPMNLTIWAQRHWNMEIFGDFGWRTSLGNSMEEFTSHECHADNALWLKIVWLQDI